ncbi:MAG: hypothetical protein RJA76_2052, partial [Bacteroidota bacterium]
GRAEKIATTQKMELAILCLIDIAS